MALIFGPPPPPRFPSGRYTQTNPLRREYGLLLLTGSLPEPLRTRLIRAWRQPAFYAGTDLPLVVQRAQRPRPSELQLADVNLRRLRRFTATELALSRRLVEAPREDIPRETRQNLLLAQGEYLRRLYAALSVRLGAAAALAEFERLMAGAG